jgi:hypothetical protein
MGQVGESCDLVNDRRSSLRGPSLFRCGIVESRIRGCTKGSLVVGSGRVISSREQPPGAVKERLAARYDDIVALRYPRKRPFLPDLMTRMIGWIADPDVVIFISPSSVNNWVEKAHSQLLEMYQPALILLKTATAFQADDEGSIPFTRSNVFKDLHHGCGAVTSGLLLILTNVPHLFAPPAVSGRPPRPVSWSASRSAVAP